MSLKYVDISAAIRRVGERRIEEAMKEGAFDHLAGMGKPLELEPMPADEGARMVWWAVRLLRQNGMSEFAVHWSRQADTVQR
jgi:hypothetical protein